MVREFVEDEEGQGLIEYLLILSLVAVVVIISLTLLGLDLKNYYNKIVNDINTPSGG